MAANPLDDEDDDPDEAEKIKYDPDGLVTGFDTYDTGDSLDPDEFDDYPYPDEWDSDLEQAEEAECWFCMVEDNVVDGEMEFSAEFDSWVHMDCLQEVLLHQPGNHEGPIMARELGVNMNRKYRGD